MNEREPNSIESCPNPKIYQFDSLTELIEFENQIALEVCPHMDERDIRDWLDRVPIHKTLRPKDPRTKKEFNGHITNISLSEMPEAYDRLYDAGERGLMFGDILGRPFKKHAKDNVDFFKEYTRGYNLTAEAKSTGISGLGEINAEIWYLPTPQNQQGHNCYILPGTNNIRRYATRPILEWNNETINEESEIDQLDRDDISKKVGKRAVYFNYCRFDGHYHWL